MCLNNLAGESNGFLFKQRCHYLLLSCDRETCGSARRDYSMKRTEEHCENLISGYNKVAINDFCHICSRQRLQFSCAFVRR